MPDDMQFWFDYLLNERGRFTAMDRFSVLIFLIGLIAMTLNGLSFLAGLIAVGWAIFSWVLARDMTRMIDPLIHMVMNKQLTTPEQISSKYNELISEARSRPISRIATWI